MRVLVTGGAGYIGSVVVEELLAAKHDVIVLDNLSKGHRESVQPDLPFANVDLINTAEVSKVLRKYDVNAVIHMAASSLVGESVVNPRLYYENNVVAGLSLLNAMMDTGVKKIVFSSTAATYGEPEKQPIEENDPTHPTNPYGESKLAFEGALKWYHRAYGLGYCSLRYFNAAGATEKSGEDHDPESHLIPIVLQAAAGKRSHVDVYGEDYPTRDRTCVRDYIHVVDLARAHVLAIDAIENRGLTFNLGCGGEGYTVREIVDIARKVTGKNILERIVGRRPGDPAVLIASSERIKKELGWKPEFQDPFKIIESAWKWAQLHPDGYKTR